MEKLERYRDLIKQQIHRYVESFSEGANSDIKELEVLDDERGVKTSCWLFSRPRCGNTQTSPRRDTSVVC